MPAGLAIAMSVHAQTGATRPIRMIVPFPPAGSSDVIARTLAAPLGKLLGQNVVVDNRPGGGTVIGTALAARAPADGHTLMICLASLTINPAIRASLPYDTLRDFAGVGKVATQPYLFVSSATSPPASFSELLSMARARPGELSAGTSGVGTGQHLVLELLKQKADVNVVHVPYQGSAPVVGALVGGQLAFAVLNLPDVAPHVQSGRLRVLATAAGTRSPALKSVPTVGESGIADFSREGWVGLVTQRAVAPQIIARLNEAIGIVLTQPDARARIEGVGFTVSTSTPEAFDSFLRSEVQSNQALANRTNLRVE
ncbi:MAG: tripartite tricarboxylate transporter substrate-binding protein [Proteobacteria bacterium]|nr:tripartite tricarboxylate transporter substrate-binding protein [Pseudomonadota bacterium]